MPYSAVTQPRPWPLSQGGSRSSSVAVTSTWVSPNFTKHEPSAYFTTPRSSDTARSSSGCRRLGRIGNLLRFGRECWRAGFLGGGDGGGKAVFTGSDLLAPPPPDNNFAGPGASMSQDVPIG